MSCDQALDKLSEKLNSKLLVQEEHGFQKGAQCARWPRKPKKSLAWRVLSLACIGLRPVRYLSYIHVHGVREFSSERSAVHAVTVERAKSCDSHAYAHATYPYSYTKWHMLQLQWSKTVTTGNDDHA